ncbi:mercuric transport protein MerTP [Algoriphagus sp. AK58]|jgi:mercuric ion transport protein|uniref:mercuric transport protein MerTP n=1 Tax=Algoriphagus sp. AK58 TaxID=1406877 RepID=UPI0016508964|nr:mercuric transport protein MerTP [Algoriphagus sp. AK58]MBC6367569.1 mercuric transport protein MerTP [Algoriphagus sp. AK58]
MKKSLLTSGLLAALVSSLCCITPVLALVAGASGIASTFSWLDPARPFFVSITVIVLGFAWYQKLKTRKEEDIECACEDDEKPSFWQTKKFLSIITVLAALMLTFPLFAHIFYPKADKQLVIVEKSDIQTVNFEIKGMTCQGCATHVEHEVNKLDGILRVAASYELGNAVVEFDNTKTGIQEIQQAINSTGYSVTNKTEK